MPSALLKGHPSIDSVIIYNRTDGLKGIQKLRRELRSAGPFDITLNLNVYFKSVWPTLLSRAPRRIGFDRQRSFDGVWFASNEHIAPRPRGHTVDMLLEFAAHLGIEANRPAWRIEFTPDELGKQRAFVESVPDKPIATVIPASSSHKKDWTTEGWSEVVRALSSEFGFRVVLAGGPGNREAGIAREIEARCAVPVEWALGDSVRRMSYLLAASNLVLAPDTGPVHVARAFNVPVIGIYGHTNPWRVGPWRAFEDLWVDHYTEGQPDPSNFVPRWNVMPTIRPAEVLDKVRVAIERYGAGVRRGSSSS
jgi:heptosyltransferase I